MNKLCTSQASSSSLLPKPWNTTAAYCRFHWDTSIPMRWKLIKGTAYFKHVSDPSGGEPPVRVVSPLKAEKLLNNPGLTKTPSVNVRLKNYFRSPKKIQSCEKLRPKKREIRTQLPVVHSTDYAVTKYSLPNPLLPVYKSAEEESFSGTPVIQEFMQRFKKRHTPLVPQLPNRGLKGALVRKSLKPRKQHRSESSALQFLLSS